VNTKISLTIKESILKYSAIPPQTPVKTLSLFDLYNLFSIFSQPPYKLLRIGKEYIIARKGENNTTAMTITIPIVLNNFAFFVSTISYYVPP
jgi:hypothetical protein